MPFQCLLYCDTQKICISRSIWLYFPSMRERKKGGRRKFALTVVVVCDKWSEERLRKKSVGNKALFLCLLIHATFFYLTTCKICNTYQHTKTILLRRNCARSTINQLGIMQTPLANPIFKFTNLMMSHNKIFTFSQCLARIPITVIIITKFTLSVKTFILFCWWSKSFGICF